MRPFRPLEDAFNALAELADFAFGSTPVEFFGRRFGPDVTATWSDGSYVVTVDLPGVPEDALSVSVADRTLVLEAKTDEMEWSQRILLSRDLDVDAIHAEYLNGRLTVTVPAKPEAQPRKIEITVGTSSAAQLGTGGEAIEATESAEHTEQAVAA